MFKQLWLITVIMISGVIIASDTETSKEILRIRTDSLASSSGSDPVSETLSPETPHTSALAQAAVEKVIDAIVVGDAEQVKVHVASLQRTGFDFVKVAYTGAKHPHFRGNIFDGFESFVHAQLKAGKVIDPDGKIWEISKALQVATSDTRYQEALDLRHKALMMIVRDASYERRWAAGEITFEVNPCAGHLDPLTGAMIWEYPLIVPSSVKKTIVKKSDEVKVSSVSILARVCGALGCPRRTRLVKEELK